MVCEVCRAEILVEARAIAIELKQSVDVLTAEWAFFVKFFNGSIIEVCILVQEEDELGILLASEIDSDIVRLAKPYVLLEATGFFIELL